MQGAGGTVRDTGRDLFLDNAPSAITPNGAIDISGFATVTVADFTGSVAVGNGFDNATGTIPAIYLDRGVALFNNSNVLLTATQYIVVRPIVLGHNNTNITFQANLLEVFGSVQAGGTVLFDAPAAELCGLETNAAVPDHERANDDHRERLRPHSRRG